VSTLRQARAEDAAAIAALAETLGYPIEVEVLGARLDAALEDTRRTILVVEVTGSVSAWMEVAEFESLTSGRSASIVGLVIDPQLRRLGLGRRLVEAAADWARARGHDTLRVRTRVERGDAHAFYQQLGFEQLKQQSLFAFALSPE